jgi:hypothetical protein
MNTITRDEIIEELSWTESEACFFIAKAVKEGRLFRVKRGLYDKETTMAYIQDIKERKANYVKPEWRREA